MLKKAKKKIGGYEFVHTGTTSHHHTIGGPSNKILNQQKYKTNAYMLLSV